jgi:hypothetical protein
MTTKARIDDSNLLPSLFEAGSAAQVSSEGMNLETLKFCKTINIYVTYNVIVGNK